MTPDPTAEFNLITFADLEHATYSGATIRADRLGQSRILIARLGQQHVKLQVHRDGQDLRISRLTLYDADGCIERVISEPNLRIEALTYCDLRNTTQTLVKADGDFRWYDPDGHGLALEPGNRALFAVYSGFEEVDYTHVRKPSYVRADVEQFFLQHQLIFCCVEERFAKLFVESGDELTIRQFAIFGPGGDLESSGSDLVVPTGSGFDLASATVGPQHQDLRWEGEGTTHMLRPGNRARIAFPSYFSFIDYLILLRELRIRLALVYEDENGVRNYDAWSELERRQLWEVICLREGGREIPRFGLPPLIDGSFLRSNDAKRIHFAHVGQSLWVEVHRSVPWRLLDASDVELVHLFDMRTLLAFHHDRQHHRFDLYTMNVTQWNPTIAWSFLVTERMIGLDHWQTITALAAWCREYLVHVLGPMSTGDGGPFASTRDQDLYLFGYEGLTPVERMIHPLPDRPPHRTRGCWWTDGFLIAVLRTANIAARHGTTQFVPDAHSRAEFFTVSQNLAHGDDLYDSTIRLGQNNVPIERIFYSDVALRDEIDAPLPREGMDQAATAAFNYRRRFRQLAVEYKTDHVLRRRCQDIQAGHVDHDETSHLWSALHEFYSDGEIDQIAADCDTAISALADSCSTRWSDADRWP